MKLVDSTESLNIYIFKVTLKWTKRPIPELSSDQFNETPFFRYGHTCVYYEEHKLVYLWGGRSDFQLALCNKLFTYNPKTHKWSSVKMFGSIPFGRDGPSATIVKNSMYVFGGFVQAVSLIYI